MKRAFIVFSLMLAAPRLRAQERGAAALGELIEGLGTTTRVLMIGAHPDDEDTQVITWLAKARHIQTAYLSLTRGDGGQNLIGNELGPELGMIRTEELLAARRIDGGRQYFTRAYDFGFTKTLDETLQRWPRDSILKDMVEIVRAFRPHVIIAVWTGTPADGHGQHQYAGVLAREVFDAAADSVRFPAASVGGLPPWVTPKFYRGGYRAERTLSFNVGEFDPLLGVTYSEIAAVSRSQHRSQGQGELSPREPRTDGVRLEVSRVSNAQAPEHGLFDGLDTSWARFRGLSLADTARAALDSLTAAQAVVTASLDMLDPAKAAEPLARYVRLALRALTGVHCTTLDTTSSKLPACTGAMGDLALALASTRERATNALLDAASVSVDATAPRELVAEHDSLPVTISVFDNGPLPIVLEHASLTGAAGAGSKRATPIAAQTVARDTLTYHAGDTPTISWWLRHPRRGDTFVQPMAEMIVGDDRLEDSGAEVVLRIAGVSVPMQIGPIVYRFADPARGEVRRPIAAVPEISVLLEHEVEYARANVPFDRTFVVSLRSAATGPRVVDVSLRLPAGVRADTAVRRVTVAPFGEAQVYFRVQGRLAAGRSSIEARAAVGEHEFTLGYIPIEYEHIRPLRYYRPSSVALEAVNATFANLKVGYVRGVGDNVMPMLAELGLPVTELDPAKLPQTPLSEFTTIVLGPRAYEANPALVANNAVLMRFVRDGGTIVTQYGQYLYARPGVLPYPITLGRPADRVTDETAPVRVLDPASPLLSAPNHIAESDFSNWVQERSLYMPRTFDPQYHALFSMNDPGEQPNDGAVLVAPVGKGIYVYTTMSFFRQLPAGNPGAARLFINFLSAGHTAVNRPAARSSPVRP